MAGEQNQNKKSEELVLLSLSNTMKLTNLVLTERDNYCATYGDRRCSRGRPGRTRNTGTTTYFKPSGQFYSKGSINWKFEGQTCFSFEAVSMFHLFLSLSPGSLEEGWIEVNSKFEPCPNKCTAKPWDVPKDMKECLLYITLRISNSNVCSEKRQEIHHVIMNKTSKLRAALHRRLPTKTSGKDAFEVKVLKFDIGSTLTGWSGLALKNKCFMPMEALKNTCQVRSQGAFPDEIGTSYEFIDMDVQLKGVSEAKLMFPIKPEISHNFHCYVMTLKRVK